MYQRWAALALLVVTFASTLLLSSYKSFRRNLRAAKDSGIPYIICPIDAWGPFWRFTGNLWFPWPDQLPRSLTGQWIDFMPEPWHYKQGHAPFAKLRSDTLLLVSPGRITLYVADASAAAQITSRLDDFPKALELYEVLNVFGKNVVTLEGNAWRRHRKVISGAFTEGNNRLVWDFSLQQARRMIDEWTNEDSLRPRSTTIKDASQDTMRLSLHVISRSGFGLDLLWPHQERRNRLHAKKSQESLRESQPVLAGKHIMSFQTALQTLLKGIFLLIVCPRWLAEWIPSKRVTDPYLAYDEWRQYMREIYRSKQNELQGRSAEHGDLIGSIANKGARLPNETSQDTADKFQQKQSHGLSEDEVLGNMFNMLLAGHETTANIIYFSILGLAMNPDCQRQLQCDLDLILGDRPVGQWSYDQDLPRLFGGMTGAVMNETMRVFSPILNIPKRAAKDQSLVLNNGRHVTVPGGSLVLLATTATHRNPKYYPHFGEGSEHRATQEDLRSFRPQRWLLDGGKPSSGKLDMQLPSSIDEDNSSAHSVNSHSTDISSDLFRPERGAFLVFSEGSRSCIGRRFAQVEILAVLASIFKSYSVELGVDDDCLGKDWHLDDDVRKAAWQKARDRAQDLLQNGTRSLLTLQMRDGKVPLRLVKRGHELFDF